MTTAPVRGYSRDRDDDRDAYFDKHPIGQNTPEPSKTVDPLGTGIEIYDQGWVGSCTANAIAAALEYGRLKHLNQASSGGGDPSFRPSRLYIYYNERSLEAEDDVSSHQDQDSNQITNNHVLWDTGAQIRDGIKGIKRYGVGNETQWAYGDGEFATYFGDGSEWRGTPTDKVYEFQAGSPGLPPPGDINALRAGYLKDLGTEFAYYRIATQPGSEPQLHQIKRCLSAGYPVVFGFTCFDDDIDSKNWPKPGGKLPFPGAEEKPTAGHAVVAVGYTEDSMIIRNSWGKDWNSGYELKGHFLMPFDWFDESKTYINSFGVPETHTSDFWVIEVNSVT